MTDLFEAEQAKRAAECSLLQDKLLGAEQQQQTLRQQLLSSVSQLQGLQQQEVHSRQALDESRATQANLVSSRAILQQRCANLQAQVVASQQSSATMLPPDSAAVFQMLEQQLVSLSGLVQQKEQQVVALQETVQQQCDERTLMQIKIMQLQSAKTGDSSEKCPVLGSNSRLEVGSTGSRPSELAQCEPSASVKSAVSSQVLPGNDRASVDRASQRKSRLHRLASASEQQQGKSGLLGRIMATSSTTGKAVFE